MPDHGGPARHAVEGRRQAARLHGRLPVQGRDPRAGLPQVRVRRVRRTPRADPRRARATGIHEDQIGPAHRRRRRVHRRRRLLGPRAAPAGTTWPSTPRAAGHGGPKLSATVDGRDHDGDNPSLDRRPAADLQPGQRRPAPPRRTARPVQQRPVHRPGREQGPRPARRGLRVLPGEVRPRRGQARRRVLHPRRRRPGPRRVLEPHRGPGLRPVLRLRRHVRPGREVPPAHHDGAPATSPSTARSSTSAPGGWPR